jgi:hypothetical protein
VVLQAPERLGGRTKARNWDPLIKRHAVRLDFSRENLMIGDQWLTAKNPTIRRVSVRGSTHPRRWGFESLVRYIAKPTIGEALFFLSTSSLVRSAASSWAAETRRLCEIHPRRHYLLVEFQIVWLAADEDAPNICRTGWFDFELGLPRGLRAERSSGTIHVPAQRSPFSWRLPLSAAPKPLVAERQRSRRRRPRNCGRPTHPR